MAEIAHKKGIKQVVLSPGSRSAPITIAFARHPKINTYIIPDERSAGYIALGISMCLNQPVGLVCTSGSAAINLFSSIAEAYYQNIPLVVFTADRPPEWTDQADGQTIHQDDPADQNFKDLNWYADRIINEAINLALESCQGPVHINIPVREPFYTETEENYVDYKNPKIINSPGILAGFDEDSWYDLQKIWYESKNILIVGGQYRFNVELIQSLNRFSQTLKVPIIGDVISNLHGLKEDLITHQDLILRKVGKNLKSLAPDLLITLGKSVLSKNLKLFLRDRIPKNHWHIQESGYNPDTFQSLTHRIRLKPEDFFKDGINYFKENPTDDSYLRVWKNKEKMAMHKIHSFFPNESFSELEAVYQILNNLPDNINLHLANSLPVRLVNLIGILKPSFEVFSNRGLSGIDGCTSTAVGVSLHSDKINVLITGDMAFFYDRNGLWHNVIPGNLRIIILNNHGGGIFRQIDGPSKLPELKDYFETDQKLLARNSAADFKMDYFFSNNSKTLLENTQKLLVDNGVAKILEIETNSQINKTIFDKYISQF
jgi:2-succinyl-5-enolpyruvyl-6-hydroxy-3-cyclohexene-1-carboxylate synthase